MDDIDFSYDGNDEEAKRIATEPKKPKLIKASIKKKIELKPIDLPQQPVQITADPTPTSLSEPVTENTLSTIKDTKLSTEAVVKIPQKSEKASEINAPLLVVAAVAAAASVSVAASALKGKTNLKKNNKTKSDNKKPDNKSKEEKKKEEQKACDSKSDKVQQLIDEVNSIINNVSISSKSNSNKSFLDKVKALNLEIVLLNKQMKKIEEKITKRKKVSK